MVGGGGMIDRYDIESNMRDCFDGDWVKHDDYEKLEKENERLKKENKRLMELLEIAPTHIRRKLNDAK